MLQETFSPERKMNGMNPLFLLGIFRSFLHLLPPMRGKAKLATMLAKSIVPKEKKLFVPLITGVSMFIDFNIDVEVLMYFGFFDPLITRLLKNLLNPGDIFLDCGANVGYFSFLTVPLVGNKGRIIAIEPNPICAERIRQSKEHGNYDHLVIFEVAAGQQSGKKRFNVADDHMYSSFCDLGQLGFASQKSNIEVVVSPIDAILEQANIQHVKLLKLDIEGAEIFALKGAEHALNAFIFDYILAEIHQTQLNLMGYDSKDFHALLKQHGYICVNPLNGRKTLSLYRSPTVKDL